MLRVCTIAVLCFMVLSYSHTGDAVFHAFANTKHPTMDACVDPKTGFIVRQGVPVQVTGKCVEATCSRSYFLQYQKCGPIIDRPAGYIYVKEDLSKPWPDCCPTVIFPKQ